MVNLPDNGGEQVTSYTASFTITSATGDVTGTGAITVTDKACCLDSGDFIVAGISNYQATIQASGVTAAPRSPAAPPRSRTPAGRPSAR
jgi:hypothetical protein